MPLVTAPRPRTLLALWAVSALATQAGVAAPSRAGAVEPPRLEPSAPSLGFLAVARDGEARPSGTIVLYDSADRVVPWQASVDRPWLRVGTIRGTARSSGSTVTTVSFEPAGLTTGLHYGHVIFSPVEAGQTGPASVVVGVYVDPDRVTPLGQRAASGGALALEVDPTRPFLYVTDGGERVDVYDARTGALDGAITIPGARILGARFSKDGDTLIVESGESLYELDLDRRTVERRIRIPCR